MRNIKQLFNFYISSSLHVGLAILVYAKIVSLHFHQNANFNWFYFVFFATTVGYNFLKYYEFFTTRNYYFGKFFYVIFAVSLIGILFSIYFFLKLNNSLKINIFICSLLVFLYPFLRRFWYLKTICVAICVTVFIFSPYFNFSIFFKQQTNEIGINHFLYILKIFLFLLASMIPFEIYDAQYDDKTLQTIPQKFGVKITKIIGYFLIIFFIILCIFENKTLRIDFIIAILMVLAIFFSSKNRSKYFCSFWVESIPIIWLFLLSIFC